MITPILLIALASAYSPALPANIEDVTPSVRAEVVDRYDALSATPTTPSGAYASALAAYGEVLIAHGLEADAIAPLRAALDLRPEQGDWRYVLAFTLSRLGDQDGALAEYTVLLDADPGDAIALIRRGCLQSQMGRLEGAAADLDLAAELVGEHAFALTCRARVTYLDGDYAATVRMLERVLELQPSVDSVHHMLGMAYRQQGDVTAARDHLQRQGDVEPTFRDERLARIVAQDRSVQSLVERALDLIRSGHPQAAEREIRSALEASPEDVSARMALVALYNANDQLDLAIPVLLDIVRTDPDYAPARYRLGQIASAQGDLTTASERYAEALVIQPDNLEAGYQRASMLLQIDETEAAIAQLQHLVDLVPDNVFIRLQFATALLAGGRCEDALATTRTDDARAPGRADLLIVLVRASAACADGASRREMLPIADQLLAMRPAPIMYELRALLRRSLGDTAGARADLEVALRDNADRGFGDVLRARYAAMTQGAAEPGPIPPGHPLRTLPGTFGNDR